MKRMLAILVLCTAFSTGFVPQGEALPAPAAEASWPDSLRPTEYYTEGVKKLLIGEDTLAARALFLQPWSSIPRMLRPGSASLR